MIIFSICDDRIERIKEIKKDLMILSNLKKNIMDDDLILISLENIFFEYIDSKTIIEFKRKVINNDKLEEFLKVYLAIGEQGIKCCINAL